MVMPSRPCKLNHKIKKLKARSYSVGTTPTTTSMNLRI